MTRYAIDPVTRIEGHLRLEIETSGGKVTDAWSSGTMFRGVERIMAGRNPLEVWMLAQRVCGVCTHVHAISSVRAVEQALGVVIPANARILRNVVSGAQLVHDHVVHFYHLHLPDWVDVTATLDADPEATASLAASTNTDWQNNSIEWFTTVRSRLAALASSGQLGPFASGYWGHKAYGCTPEESLLLYAHYLEALEFQREIVKIHAHIGGKNPHPQTYAVGGMATWFAADANGGVNTASLAAMREIARRALRFVDQVLLPDVALLARRYGEWFGVGAGIGNLLSYGDLPTAEGSTSFLFPAGRIMGRDLDRVLDIDTDRVAETVARSWYSYAEGDKELLHPFEGETSPHYTGPQPPYTMIGDAEKYSWLKAPRYDAAAYEVGPLARVLIGYAGGRPAYRNLVDDFLASAGGRRPAEMFSTMGRLAARALETHLVAAELDSWLAQLERNQAAGELAIAATVPARTQWGRVQGFGVTEAPRGALGHWVVIDDGAVESYQLVVPTTWNGSPRDAAGNRGAWESALMGTPLADPHQPLEVLRTVHSFDPCMGCAVHVLSPDGAEPLCVVEVV